MTTSCSAVPSSGRVSCNEKGLDLLIPLQASLLQQHSNKREGESSHKERVEVGTESESREQKQTEEGKTGTGEGESGGGKLAGEVMGEGTRG